IECRMGALCSDERCMLPHPPGRGLAKLKARPSRDRASRGQNSGPGGSRDNSDLKTPEERALYRIESGLPILASQDDFVRRLKAEKVVVVTAETGSGKTTQLPQYAAENFPLKVACTQPRALAAVSLAKRIGYEFDGEEVKGKGRGIVGRNVGFRAGGGRPTNGDRIMLMTDAALIKEAQHDDTLSQYSVLVIDEAHERSLNTDLVLGIAKLVM
ncbi:hypothetical protein KIPB_015517, partial [Kipferlia bialata]